MSTSDNPNNEVSLTSSEIYLAAEQGVLSQDDANRLVRWGPQQRFNQPAVAQPKVVEVEQRKGFPFVLAPSRVFKLFV